MTAPRGPRQVHPLRADESPEDHADVTRFREWRNELAHGASAAWDAGAAARAAAAMLGFVERHSDLETWIR